MESTVTTNSLANIEALMNIFGNASEIAGIHNATFFVGAAFLILFIRNWSVSVKYFLFGLGFLIVGLAMPGLINLGSPSHGANSGVTMLVMVLSGLATAAMIIVTLGLFYYPVHIAKKRGVTSLSMIIGLSGFSIVVPILWPIAMLIAHKAKKPLLYDPAKDVE